MQMKLQFPFLSFGKDMNAQDLHHFYPDIFDDTIDKTKYRAIWQRLSKPNLGLLIVRDGQIQPVGVVSYVFEWLKGILGYGNACHPAKIKMAAQKLAYYGYLKGFNEETTMDAIQQWAPQYRPNDSYIDACKKRRSNQISAVLQQELILFYQSNTYNEGSEKGCFAERPLPASFKFGETYAMAHDLTRVVQLDPQDETLINEHLLDVPNGECTLPESTCRRLFINHKLNEIQNSLEEVVRKKAAEVGIHFSFYAYSFWLQQEQASSFCIENKCRETLNILSLWPELVSAHLDLLQMLSMQLSEANSAPDFQLGFDQMTLYLIKEHCERSVAFDYLRRNYLSEDRFLTLDFQSEFVQSWGEYLFQYSSQLSHFPMAQYLYCNRAAQLRAYAKPAHPSFSDPKQVPNSSDLSVEVPSELSLR